MRLLDNHGKVMPDVMKMAVALSLVPGWEVFRKFGMNDDVNGAGTKEQMWPPGTIKTLPTAAGTVSVVSDSVEDDPAGAGTSTGSWTVTLVGLDANYLEQSETITMDGTTPVVSTKSFIRLFRMFSVTSGTAGTNVGNISASIGGNLQSYIEADEGQSHQTDYCVPADKYLLIDYYMIRVGRMAGTSDAHIQGEIRLNAGESDESWRSISDIYLYNGGGHSNDSSATLLPPKTDLRQRISSTAATQAVGVFGGYLVETSVVASYL